MKKIIITIILLVLSISAASAKTTLNLDSIFANTLAFKARLDTAVYVANPYYYPINNDKHIGNTYRMYRISMTCYTKIKNHKIPKKEIPEVIDDILTNYEPYFASLLSKPVKEVHLYAKPQTTKYSMTISRYDLVVDGERHNYSIEKPYYETKYHDDLKPGHWYSINAVRADGTKVILYDLISDLFMLYGFPMK